MACVHGRAEEFAAEHRESFDLAVSRAVAALPVLCELCLPLVRPGGLFLCSGIIDTRAEEVAAKLREAGLTILEQQSDDGWYAFTCR